MPRAARSLPMERVTMLLETVGVIQSDSNTWNAASEVSSLELEGIGMILLEKIYDPKRPYRECIDC